MEVVVDYVKELLGQWPAEITLVSFMNNLSKSGYFHHTSYFCTNLFIVLFMSVTADMFVFQLAFRELKPHPTADVDRRRDQKKKHKTS